MLILVLLLLVYNVVVIRKVKVTLETMVSSVEKGQKVPFGIMVENAGRFPTGKIWLKVVKYENHQRKKVIFTGVSLKGRRQESQNVQTKIQCCVEPKQLGMVSIVVKRAYSFDLLGLFCLPLKKKQYSSQRRVAVVPKVYEMPLEITGHYKKDAFGNEERYDLYMATDSDSEIYQMRQYVQGDSLAAIHWKLSAKKEDYIIAERRKEEKKKDDIVVFIESIPCKKGRRTSGSMEIFYTVLFSLSYSLQRSAGNHYIAWRNKKTGRMERFLVSSKTQVCDLYELIPFETRSRSGDSKENLEELCALYRVCYRENPIGVYLDGRGRLILKDGSQTEYVYGELKDKLTSEKIQI